MNDATKTGGPQAQQIVDFLRWPPHAAKPPEGGPTRSFTQATSRLL